MRIAIIHDWLTGMRGGEKCLRHFLQLYPEADIYTLVHKPGSVSSDIEERIVQTSFIQRAPRGVPNYRMYLPLFPAAIRSFDLSGYDFVLSLSHAAAKNVSLPRSVPHVSYCFTPMRYIWDQVPHYFGALAPAAWPLIAALRAWDRNPKHQPNLLVGISQFIQARIRNVYGAKSEVVYPPVDTSWITARKEHQQGQAFLYAGALVPYKRVDLIIEAFNRLGEKLIIAGNGPEYRKLRKLAKNNVQFLSDVDDAALAQLYRDCRALLFPGEEDFGMVPIECMAAGRPVIAGFHGATKETIEGVRCWESGAAVDPNLHSGVFALPGKGEAAISGLIQAISFFIQREDQFSAAAALRQAAKFTPERFYDEWNSTMISGGYGLAARPLPKQPLEAAVMSA